MNFKVASPKINAIKLPSVQQQLAVVNNQALKQLYLSQKSTSNAQRMGKNLSSAKSTIYK